MEDVNAPTLYVKEGCPYCRAAMDYLDGQKIAYYRVDVRGDKPKMEKLKKLSGQTKTPTMEWGGKVLADFGVQELQEFLAGRQPVSASQPPN